MEKKYITASIIVLAFLGGGVLYTWSASKQTPSPQHTPEETCATVEGGVWDGYQCIVDIGGEDVQREPFARSWVWLKTVIDSGEEIIPNHLGDFVLSFNDGLVSIKTDCNNMSASFVEGEGVLSFGEITATEMYCEESIESEFSSTLLHVESFSLSEDNQLMLYFNSPEVGGMMLFEQERTSGM